MSDDKDWGTRLQNKITGGNLNNVTEGDSWGDRLQGKVLTADKVQFGKHVSDDDKNLIKQAMAQQPRMSDRIADEIMRMQMILSAIFDKYGEIELNAEDIAKADPRFAMIGDNKDGVIKLRKVVNPYIIKTMENKK